jgi:hypothetical protein
LEDALRIERRKAREFRELNEQMEWEAQDLVIVGERIGGRIVN